MVDIFYGGIKDHPDSRDYPFSSTRMVKASMPMALPPIADISYLAPPVKNQGPIGSCVACAVAGAFETIIRGLDETSQIQLSVLDLYRTGH